MAIKEKLDKLCKLIENGEEFNIDGTLFECLYELEERLIILENKQKIKEEISKISEPLLKDLLGIEKLKKKKLSKK